MEPERLGWAPIVLAGFLMGFLAGPGAPVSAQRTTAPVPELPADQSRALNQINGVRQPPEFRSTIPAPLLSHGVRTMWPNQPNEATFWSIDDLRKAHQVLAEAGRNGRSTDSDATLHGFPYWTRTHAMFVKHVGQKARSGVAEQHLGYAQFIVVMGGRGTVVAGGALSGAVALKEGKREIPGELRGRAVSDGETFSVNEGDWVSIPPNTPSLVRADSPDGLTYMVMKINAQLYPWELIR